MLRITAIALIGVTSSSYRGCACYWPTHEDVRTAAAVAGLAHKPYSADVGCEEIRFYAADDTDRQGSYSIFRRVNGKWVWSGGVEAFPLHYGDEKF